MHKMAKTYIKGGRAQQLMKDTQENVQGTKKRFLHTLVNPAGQQSRD